jgi:hypothetical protein
VTPSLSSTNLSLVAPAKHALECLNRGAGTQLACLLGCGARGIACDQTQRVQNATQNHIGVRTEGSSTTLPPIPRGRTNSTAAPQTAIPPRREPRQINAVAKLQRLATARRFSRSVLLLWTKRWVSGGALVERSFLRQQTAVLAPDLSNPSSGSKTTCTSVRQPLFFVLSPHANTRYSGF